MVLLFFRSFKLVGTIIECEMLLLSRLSDRYGIVLHLDQEFILSLFPVVSPIQPQLLMLVTYSPKLVF